MTQLIWLRSDLRLHDNTALSAAMAAGFVLVRAIDRPRAPQFTKERLS